MMNRSDQSDQIRVVNHHTLTPRQEPPAKASPVLRARENLTGLPNKERETQQTKDPSESPAPAGSRRTWRFRPISISLSKRFTQQPDQDLDLISWGVGGGREWGRERESKRERQTGRDEWGTGMSGSERVSRRKKENKTSPEKHLVEFSNSILMIKKTGFIKKKNRDLF